MSIIGTSMSSAGLRVRRVFRLRMTLASRYCATACAKARRLWAD
jgi:hypothetical protein